MTFSVFLISISFLRHSCIVSQRCEALVCLCVHSCKVINEIRGGIYRRGSSPSRLSPFYIFFGLASLKEKRKAASEQILTESFRPTFFGQNRPKNFSLGFWLIFERLHAA